MPVTFSLKEAAIIVGVPERTIRRAIEMKNVLVRAAEAGRVHRYQFVVDDLVYLKLLTVFPFPLAKAGKRAWGDIVREKRLASGRWRANASEIVATTNGIEIHVELKHLRSDLANRLWTFHRGRRRIVSDPEVLGGEPVFKGTRIPLAHIVGLLRKNVPVAEISEDYPRLGPLDLCYAQMIAQGGPNPDRPRKPLTILRGGRPVVTRDTRVNMRATSA